MEEAAPPPPPPVRPLLVFDDPFKELQTRPQSFEGIVTPGEVVSLNHIRYVCRHAAHASSRCLTGLACMNACMRAATHVWGDAVLHVQQPVVVRGSK